jgi:hypothetical protein
MRLAVLGLLAAAAVVAVIAVNVALLSFGADRHDPVGQLSPVATFPLPATPVVRGEDD